jgi:hypothetical protein
MTSETEQGYQDRMITAQAARRSGRPRNGSAAVSSHPGPACRYCGRGIDTSWVESP